MNRARRAGNRAAPFVPTAGLRVYCAAPVNREPPVTDAFDTLPLPAAQLANLNALGYRAMTPIQAQALPVALAGHDLIAQAKTGSGKTAAFAIALLERLNPRFFGCQALVLCPTRELSTQVAEEIRRLARYRDNIKVLTLCGGQPIGPQIGSLEHGAHVVVGTPGRIQDHLRKATLDLSQAGTLVLDEADRMLDMGFMEAMVAIIGGMPKDRQTLLFSATYPDDIQALSARFQRTPQRITVPSRHSGSAIEQRFYLSEPGALAEDLSRVLADQRPSAAVVFCNTKEQVRELCAWLAQRGTSALALHGDLEQRDRDQVLIRFKHGSAPLLVATDVAARGLDVENLPLVINYHLPRDPDVYVHRIGRTGRAGQHGLAVTLLLEKERFKLERLAADLELDASTPPAAAIGAPLISPLKAPHLTLCIQGGRKDKLRPGDILGALTGDAGLDGASIGKIDILDQVAFVAVARAVADKALRRLSEGKIKGRRFRVRKL